MARFRLIAGMHATGSKKLGTQRVLKKNDIITTDNPTEIAFFRKYPDKYQPVPDGISFTPPVKPTDDDVVEIDLSKLDGMTVNELKALATEAGIDLRGATQKDQIIAIIKEV